MFALLAMPIMPWVGSPATTQQGQAQVIRERTGVRWAQQVGRAER